MESVNAEAIFDFNPADSIELTFKKGDHLTIRRNAGNGWLEGEKDGKVGLLPSSYVRAVESPPPSGSNVPTSAKKPLIENMLAPEQRSTFILEKAAALFVDNQKGTIVAGPQWKPVDQPMVIIVRDPQIETRYNGIKQYTVYVVETEALGAVVSRRYKHFLWLYDRLADLFPCLSLPPMPVKQYSGNLDPEFVYNRRRGLERFLSRCACHPVFAHSKVFRDFLTLKDEKEWRIGSKHKSKKLFAPSIYSAVEYPQHNVPHSELVYVDKFSQFMRLLETNILPVQQACQKQGDGYGSVALNLNELGCNLQKLAKGTQLENRSSGSLSLQRKGTAPVTGMSSVQKQIQRSAAELEESTEAPSYNWGWKDSKEFTTLMSDLQEVGIEICKIAESFNFQHGIMDQTLTDLITDYNGIILTIPGLVKLHQEAMEIYETSKEKDTKRNAETMKQNCETLHNIVLAEFDYLHRNLIADFRYMIALYLRKQADFHLQLAERYELLHQSFLHLDTNLGCQPPMSSNGVEVTAEESDSEDDTGADDRKSPVSPPLPKKKLYLNVFPKSCYQNVQFKQSKGSPVKPMPDEKPPPDAPVSIGTNIVEVEVMNPLSSPPVNSPASTSPDSCPTTSSPITADSTIPTTLSDVPDTTRSSAVMTSATVTSTGNDTTTTTTTTTVTKPVPTTHGSSNCESSATVTSVPTATSEASTSATKPASNSGEVARVVTKSSIIEVGGINPVYQSWELKKKRSDSSAQAQAEMKETTTTPNKDIPKSGGKTGAYDMMEPILKPSTHNSSIFFSVPCSVSDTLPDSQTVERVQSIAPSSYYENVVPIGNGKFTVTPPDSVGSKDSDHFPLDSTPPSKETNLNRSNSTGSLLPRPTVQQQHGTFYSPGSNRRDVLQYSVSAGPTQMKTSTRLTTEQSKITIRGSTAINTGSVKKKINLFESSTLPVGKSLADMGIIEDDDDNNGFIV